MASLVEAIQEYADSRALDFKRYTEYHMRIFDSPNIVDVWTTGKYYVLSTDYGGKAIERGGEKGTLPHSKAKMFAFLDGIFYAAELATGVDDFDN